MSEFKYTCHNCHTLFEEGAIVCPDLLGSWCTACIERKIDVLAKLLNFIKADIK